MLSSNGPSASGAPEDVRNGLAQAAKEANQLYEENKDLQGRFVNDLSELQRMQHAISQMEAEQRIDQLQQARHTMGELQRRASQLYEMLMNKRSQLLTTLNTGVHYVAMLQNTLIGERLLDWRNRQKLAQVGVPFENREQLLDDIQMEFEFLAEQNWSLRTFACWQLDLVRRGPLLTDNNAQQCTNDLTVLTDRLSKLLCVLVSQSFVVTLQPDPVLKTQHKFGTEVRLLIGDKLGIRQHLVNTNVTVRIIAEEEARLLFVGQLNEKDIKTVGTISNDFEKMMMDEKGHMAAKFNNSKLTRIAHRKATSKTSTEMRNNNTQAATDQKYALLFNISSFHLGNLGKFDVWTLSLPLMVTVHGSQDCDAQGAILWHRAFSHVNRSQNACDVQAVSWPELSHVLRHKFSLFTGAKRALSDSDLAYLADKLFVLNTPEPKPITFHRFAKANLKDDVTFSFWEWLFSIMQLIKQKLLKFWDEGWCVGFISKQDASNNMVAAAGATFLLRFSDTQTGAVSIGFVCEDEDGQRVPFHLSPFSIKDLDQLSLAQRIASCPQLRDVRHLYPDIDKEEMLKYFDTEERQKTGSDSPTGYIQSEIVMVAKTAGKLPSVLGSVDSPSPLSNMSRESMSPGQIFPPQSNELVDDIMMFPQLDNVEHLLGPDFRPQLPMQPLQHFDLPFVDPNFYHNGPMLGFDQHQFHRAQQQQQQQQQQFFDERMQ